MAIATFDDRSRYGWVTRLLHWGMAILLAWQFAGMAVKWIFGRAPISAFWVGTHVSVGTLLMVLILIRLGWALSQRCSRPAHGAGFWGRSATLGHLALYGCMLVVPLLALLRQFGSGRDFTVFGVTLLQGSGERIAWMAAPANALHGLLAWILLAMVAGHVAMVLVHRFVWRDDVLSRMAGSNSTAASLD